MLSIKIKDITGLQF